MEKKMFIWTVGDLIKFLIIGLFIAVVGFLFLTVWLEDKWRKFRKWLRRA